VFRKPPDQKGSRDGRSIEKPRSEVFRPEITRLPRLTWQRRLVRRLIAGLLRFLVWLWVDVSVRGLENIPPKGPLLFVCNHLGDLDLILGIVYAPVVVEFFAKAELYDYPILGKILEAYGVIWLHRGQPDRRAIRAALKVLEEGRFFAIAPEGRESLTGSLEEGTGGAAYLAHKANVPLLPATVTGTENAIIYGNLRHLRRSRVTLTVGPIFRLENLPDRREAVRNGTEKIMRILAEQLPEAYQGVYHTELERASERE
jgi:1-acyl-sn-glycerol-3-phosphate acyltransferase